MDARGILTEVLHSELPGVSVENPLTARRRTEPSVLEQEVTAMFDKWRTALLGYVVSLGLMVDDGEEVTQEAFLSLYQHLRACKSRENLRSWLFRVAHNQALKRRHQRWRQPAVDPEPNEPRDPEPNPEAALAERQRRRRLCAVVRSLPERDRCCLALRAEGLRYREIAEVLGISLAGVSTCLARSFSRLSRADGV